MGAGRQGGCLVLRRVHARLHAVGIHGAGRVRSGDRAGHFSIQISATGDRFHPAPPTRSGPAVAPSRPDRPARRSEPPRPVTRPTDTNGSPSAGFAPVVQRRDRAAARWDRRDPGIRGDDENPPLSIEQLTALALDPAVAEPAARPLQGDPEARRRWIDSAVLGSLKRHVPGVTGAEGRGVAVTPTTSGRAGVAGLRRTPQTAMWARGGSWWTGWPGCSWWGSSGGIRALRAT